MLISSPGNSDRPVWLGYVVAVISVVVAMILNLLLGAIVSQLPFLLLLAAVIVAAWYGGLFPGLFASALSAVAVLASAYFLLPPYDILDITTENTQIRLALFLLLTLLVNGLSYARSLAENKTIEQGERLRVTLESIGDAVLAVDIDSSVIFLNPVAQALTGWPQEQALGRQVHEVFNIVNEESRVVVDNPVDKVFREGQVVGLANHTVLISKDGTERPIDDSGAPIRDNDGNVVGAILVFRDITERRRVEIERTNLLRSEQQARLQAEAARYDAEASGRRMVFLAEMSRILAGSLDYEATLQAVARLAVPDIADWCSVDLLSEAGTLERLAVTHVDPAKVEWAHELQRKYPPDPNASTGAYNVIRTGKAEFISEITDEMLAAATDDPELLDIVHELGLKSAITVPLIARDRPLGVLSLVTAESGRKYGKDDLELAEALARRAAMAIDNARLYNDAQEAIKARDQFLSIASHELRTPLTAMRGNAQLIQRRVERTGQFSEKDREALGLIVKQTDRLNRMIGSLLDLSRIQTGQLSLDQGPVDLCALTQRIVEEMRTTNQGHDLELDCPDHPLIVEGDELRLEQVLLNLLQNAVKYDPGDSPIKLTVGQRDGRVCVSVADQGIGIPEAEQARLFERFYRVANANSLHVGGMGIGLFVVREIVALHGGEVSVTSKENQGSTFTVCLPLEGSGS